VVHCACQSSSTSCRLFCASTARRSPRRPKRARPSRPWSSADCAHGSRAGPLGQTYVDLDVLADAAPATLGADAPPEIPSVPSRLDELQETLRALAARVQALPLDALVDDLQAAAVAVRRAGEALPDQLERVTTETEATLGAVRATVGGPELRAALADLQATAQELRTVAASLGDDGEAAIAGLNQASVAIRDGAQQAARTVAGLDASIGARSPLWGELDRVLRESSDAARSLRLLLAYLERHPDALIRGKSEPGPP
jgi:paraquat-inducible protein B